jgi:hypothetical protein
MNVAISWDIEPCTPYGFWFLTRLIFLPRRWRWYVPPKHRFPYVYYIALYPRRWQHVPYKLIYQLIILWAPSSRNTENGDKPHCLETESIPVLLCIGNSIWCGHYSERSPGSAVVRSMLCYRNVIIDYWLKENAAVGCCYVTTRSQCYFIQVSICEVGEDRRSFGFVWEITQS